MIGHLTRKELAIAFREVAQGNARATGTLLEFLGMDPWVMGSGYAKEAAWKLLKRVELSEQQKAEVLRIARSYLQRRVGREFRYMALMVRRVATPEFVDEMEAMARDRGDDVGQRARLLAAYLRDPKQGRELQREYWCRARDVRGEA
jgi:hypothetical protein